MSAIQKIGANPTVDVELLKSKVGQKQVDQLFESDGKKKAEFLIVMLELYTQHITLAIQTQKYMKIFFLKRLLPIS